MVTRRDILKELYRWEGTPVQWKQCCRGQATDCKGLPAGVARNLGMPEGDSLAARILNYNKNFDPDDLIAGLDDTLIRTFDPKPGDVVCIIMGRDGKPRHLGMLIEKPGWMMHAYGGGIGRVCRTPLERRRVHSYWSWPSLDEGE